MGEIIAQALAEGLLTLAILSLAVAVPYMAIEAVRRAYSDVHPKN